MKKYLLLFLFCLWYHPITVAQTLSKEQTDSIDALFYKWDKPYSPGCALGIIQNGKLIYTKGYGIANLEWSMPITETTVFDIGSTSKQFTAACIVLLEQQGKLSLDDKVSKYIPELPVYAQSITIRQMLNHTSGLRDYNSLMFIAGFQEEQVTGKEDALEIIMNQKKLNFNPGEEWDYSNTGFFLASVIVERVSGKSLNEYAQEHIFVPLGMDHTFFLDDHTLVIHNRATAYARGIKENVFDINMSNWEQTGDGAIQTTVTDLLKWDQNFYEAIVGGKDLISKLTTMGKLNNGKELDYGLGLFRENFKGLELYSHPGSWAGYRAEMLRIPSEKFSVICLSNFANFDPSSIARKVTEICLKEKIKSAEKNKDESKASNKKLSKKEMASYEGNYWSDQGLVREIKIEEEQLYYIRSVDNKSALIPVGENTFELSGSVAKLTFQINKENLSEGFELLSGGRTSNFKKFAPKKMNPSDFQEIEGVYFSNELNADYSIRMEKGQLVLIPKGSRNPAPLNYLSDSTFISGNGIKIDFVKDRNGKINGFSMNMARMKYIEFVKK